MNESLIKKEISENGFTCIPGVLTNEEVEFLLEITSAAESSSLSFRKTKDLFAIRQFLQHLPKAVPIIFNTQLQNIISRLFGDDYSVVKSIYFDKPELSNWFVAYHQDLTISVKEKKEIEGFSGWTKRDGYYSVQPPLHILENNFTIRIHLDDTNENNGALKVIEGSHKYGITRNGDIDFEKETEVICNVPKGGVMIMKPLLFHASSRTKNNNRRRVVHIEFSNITLPRQLQWAEAFY